VKIRVEVFWVVTMCSVAVGCQCFREPCWRWRQQHYMVSQLRRPWFKLSAFVYQ